MHVGIVVGLVRLFLVGMGPAAGGQLLAGRAALQALPGTGYALAGECSARGHALVHGLLYASWHTFCLLLLIWVWRGGCRFSRALLHYLPV
mgnify:CR=1 FL=1